MKAFQDVNQQQGFENINQQVYQISYDAPVYAMPGMVHSSSSGSLQGMTGAGGFRYVSQTPSTGSLTAEFAGRMQSNLGKTREQYKIPYAGAMHYYDAGGMVHSGSTSSLNGLNHVSSTNSLPQVSSNGSLTSMPMQQIPQQQAWFGNFTNMIFTPDANSPRTTVNPGPIYCFDNPAQQQAAQKAATTPDGKAGTPTLTPTGDAPASPASPGGGIEPPPGIAVTPRQQPNAMSLFVGGFPVVSPHGVMAPVQQVMVQTNMDAFAQDNNLTGMPRSDSSLSLNSLPSQASDDQQPITTQYSLASSDGGSGGFPIYYQPQAFQYQAAPPSPQQHYQNSNPNYAPQQHYQQHAPQKGYNHQQYQQYQDPNHNYQNQYQDHHQNQWNGGRRSRKGRPPYYFTSPPKFQTRNKDNRNNRNDRRQDSRQNNFGGRQQNNANYRQRRNRRSKHQPPRFNDPEACKFCRTKQKFLKYKKKYSTGDICAILQCRHVDENMVPETFGERWDVSEFFQVVDFFDVSRLNEFEYFKVPRTHTDENEVVNSHTTSPMLIEIFGRQLGFRRNQIPKRFKPVSIHDVSGCDARFAVREAITQGLKSWTPRFNMPVHFQNSFNKMLHRYVGCLSLVDLCGETLPDLWTGFADSKVEGNPNAVLRWTYYFLVTWDNFHLFVEETQMKKEQTAV